MPAKLPAPLQTLVEQMAKLPGLGQKSALRVAMTLLKWPEAETRRLGSNIAALRDSLRICSRCGGVSATDPCEICADGARSRDSMCVVLEWDSLLALDTGGFYRGQYIILGALLTPQEKDAGRLELGRIMERLAEGEVQEVILALGATLEAENTATFLKEAIQKRFPHITVSRLAQGLPLGAEVKYMDHETLRQSLQFRQKL